MFDIFTEFCIHNLLQWIYKYVFDKKRSTVRVYNVKWFVNKKISKSFLSFLHFFTGVMLMFPDKNKEVTDLICKTY